MLCFHTPSLRDRIAADPILRAAAFPGADYNFSNLYFWGPCYGDVCITDTFVTQLVPDGDSLFYLYPACLHDPRDALLAIFDDCRARGKHLRFFGLTAHTCAELETYFPGKFDFFPDRDYSDYLYEIEPLCKLKGKKLQAKRNFCNRFEKEHPDWHTEPITAESIPLCRRLCDLWDTQHSENETVLLERRAISLCFEAYDALSEDGLLLFDGDTPVAFSIGSRSLPDLFDIHFEKALPDVSGAYAMICREFSRHIAAKYPQIQYLNREDDLGDLNLRQAKLSYHPILILEKFIADDREEASCDFVN